MERCYIQSLKHWILRKKDEGGFGGEKSETVCRKGGIAEFGLSTTPQVPEKSSKGHVQGVG